MKGNEVKLKLEIQMDNAAFDPHPNTEVAAILRDLASKVQNYDELEPGYLRPLHDTNGNKIGYAKVTR